MSRQRHQAKSRAIWLMTATVALSVAGCGGGLVHPTGKVTSNGEPVAEADLVFQFDADASVSYFGLSGEDGVYQVDDKGQGGLPAGQYTITVTRYVLRNGEPLPTGEQGDAIRQNGQAVPLQAEFARELVSGEDTIDFDVTDAKPQKK